MPQSEIIWLIDERRVGILVKMGTYFSLVRYTKDGMDFEVLVENDDFEIWEPTDPDEWGWLDEE